MKSKLPGCTVPKGKLLAIGGREDKGEKEKSKEQKRNIDFISEQILKRFVDELKGSNPLIAIVPTASTEPELAAKSYQDVFHTFGLTNLEVLNITDRKTCADPAYFKIVERAAGIMFTGGNQLRLTAILGGTDIMELMKERYTFSEIVVAGTSAGAAALSTPMIYEGETQGGFIKGDVRVTTGMEFLKDVAIDTHFISRGRMVRMAQAISTNPGCVGIGLEEDTAIMVTNGKEIEVIGSGLITIVDGMNITSTTIHEIKTGEPFSISNLTVHLLADGQKYTLPVYDQLHI